MREDLTLNQRSALETAIERYLNQAGHAATDVEIGLPLDSSGYPILGADPVIRVRMQPGTMLAQDLPESIEGVKVEIEFGPEMTPEILPVGPEGVEASRAAGSIQADQRCFNSPLPGGVQIQPFRAGWVGTLSGSMQIDNGRHVAYTNAHVTGLRAPAGTSMRQPNSNNRNEFAKVLKVHPLDRNSRNNLADVAVLDCKYASGHRVGPHQVKIGEQAKTFHNARMGDRLHKYGRTTLYTELVVTGFGSSRVNYGGGVTIQFRDQVFLRGIGGLGSNSGDSGSLILKGQKPCCLLFAGGGGTTIASPIRFVYDIFNGKPPLA